MQCWKLTGFFGSWRLSFPYVAIGVALIMWPHNLWLSFVCGFQLIVLAMLRMFTIFRIDGRGREDSLLPEFDESSDKWVDIQSTFGSATKIDEISSRIVIIKCESVWIEIECQIFIMSNYILYFFRVVVSSLSRVNDENLAFVGVKSLQIPSRL